MHNFNPIQHANEPGPIKIPFDGSTNGSVPQNHKTNASADRFEIEGKSFFFC